ncbi:hypothetical protein [Microscilla marina]|uniref:Uncharacterized protein n=1 Tax=Microscilla marina ATCC 23134 TaxID=313606 RepID=A1ZY89_MICM2|nr:hypothetical protein [Microscilla marina]EAY24655.1 hypothetical protein M23134_00607 [Microscilla marina ATCC 23134]
MGLLDQKRIADQLVKNYEKAEELDLPKESNKPVISSLDKDLPIARQISFSGTDMTNGIKTDLEEETLSDKERKVLAKIEKLLHDEGVSERFGIAILSRKVANRAWIKIEGNAAIPAKVIARETSNYLLEDENNDAFKEELKKRLRDGAVNEVVVQLLQYSEGNAQLNTAVALIAQNLKTLDEQGLTEEEKNAEIARIVASLSELIARL